jgi:acetylglutamate kinase
VISELTETTYNELKESGIISNGMVPKLFNGFKALHKGISEVLITNPDNFFKGRGTRLVKD